MEKTANFLKQAGKQSIIDLAKEIFETEYKEQLLTLLSVCIKNMKKEIKKDWLEKQFENENTKQHIEYFKSFKSDWTDNFDVSDTDLKLLKKELETLTLKYIDNFLDEI